MKKHQEKPTKLNQLSALELEATHGGSGSNTVFVQRNGETGILRGSQP